MSCVEVVDGARDGTSRRAKGVTGATGATGVMGPTGVGGVLAPNGKIYGIPHDSTSVLIIDPATNTANTTAITGLSGV